MLVVDTMPDSVAGPLGNLSETGMLLMASAPLVEDALYQFRFNLSDARGRETSIEVGAHLLWQDQRQFRRPDLDRLPLHHHARGADDELRNWIDAPGGQSNRAIRSAGADRFRQLKNECLRQTRRSDDPAQSSTAPPTTAPSSLPSLLGPMRRSRACRRLTSRTRHAGLTVQCGAASHVPRRPRFTASTSTIRHNSVDDPKQPSDDHDRSRHLYAKHLQHWRSARMKR